MAITRRTLITRTASAAPALALAAFPTSAASSSLGPADLQVDRTLVRLWRRLLNARAAYEAVRDAETAAVRCLPRWAQWAGRAENGCAIADPEWTDAMLAEYAIPAEVGRRPSLKQIEDLNRERLIDTYALRTGGDRQAASLLAFCDKEWKREVPPEAAVVKEANDRRVAAYRARLDQKRAEEKRVGLDGLDAQKERAWDLIDTVIDRIGEAKAHTAVGMVVKLRIWALSTLEWGERDSGGADFYERMVLTVLDGLEASLPEEVARAIPPMPLREWDRPDATPTTEAHHA
ncbi:hypothetical protein [Azospirillum sp. TSO22-1]|uniref:hypothetical protein n=1 Tax=Azospirillum sp. TSO22-1 TaxID=716789 RepID=UPI000D621A03|nr:hypothetical protein [Azospirillum sp. TSO22-1]PWC53630.1 hypothetical protein TSO221_10405 [Azospirillum sp. TSO22-1]